MGSCRAGATGRPLSAPPASSSGHGALILPQFQSGAEPGQVAQPKVGAGCSALGCGCLLRATDGGGPVLVPSPPFPSPSGAAVPERLLVQVRGCARPRRLPGLVAELLSFRHGVQAGGGPAGLARLGAPVREGRRGAGWRPDPSFCWFCSPPSLHVPNSWGPGAAPHGVREALGKRRSLGLLCPPSGQAVPKCPPPPRQRVLAPVAVPCVPGESGRMWWPKPPAPRFAKGQRAAARRLQPGWGRRCHLHWGHPGATRRAGTAGARRWSRGVTLVNTGQLLPLARLSGVTGGLALRVMGRGSSAWSRPQFLAFHPVQHGVGVMHGVQDGAVLLGPGTLGRRARGVPQLGATAGDEVPPHTWGL